MKRKDSVRAWSAFAKAGVVILLLAAAFDAHHRASASGPPAPPPPDDDPIERWQGHVPNTLYPDGPAAIPVTELSPEEQAGLDRIAERANYGSEVHGAWSSAVHSLSAEAAIQRAEHRSGMTGLEDIGVEP
jgi:hypothetical protein